MATVRKRTWTNVKGEKHTAYVVDLVDQSGCRLRKQFPTKREAEAFRIQSESQILGGTFRGDAQRVTVADAASSYLEYIYGRMIRNERMSPHNFETYKGHVRQHVLNARYGIGGVKLAHLTRGLVEDFRDRLRSAEHGGLGVATTRKVLSTTKLIIRHAESRGWTANNPVKGIEVIAPDGYGSVQVTPPSKPVFAKLLETSAPNPWLHMLIRVAGLTGVRAGEQRALRWKHVDFDRRYLLIRETYDRSRNLRPTKTYAGARDIPLSADLISDLKAYRLASPYSRDEDLIFPNTLGRPYDHDNMSRRQFKPVVAACDADGVNWHALRHYAISTWIEAGMSPKEVQTFSGHADLQTTMNRYGHLFPSEEHHTYFDAIAKQLKP